MKLLIIIATTALSIGSVYAQDNSSGATKIKPGSGSGADSNVYNQGIARDPGEVAAQQGGSSKASPGTVGASPGSDSENKGAR